MAFWWVNHKQTIRQETEGGYIWFPKQNANGAKNVTYDNLVRCQVSVQLCLRQDWPDWLGGIGC